MEKISTVSQSRSSTDTRARILATAETQFARKGYEGAHLQSIAEDVGVQKTALYYYFTSKADLYISVLQDMLDDLDSTVTGALAGDAPHPQRMEKLLDELNDVLSQRRNYSLMLVRIFTDEVRADLTPLTETVNHIIASILAFYHRGVEAGAFRNLSARNVFMSVCGLVFFHYAAQGFSNLVLGVDDIFDRETVEWRGAEVRSILFHGVLAEGDDSA